MISCPLALCSLLLAVQSLILPPREEKGLVLDAALKEQTAQLGQENAVFIFKVKNVSSETLTINQVRTSCGCTIASLPSKPWTLAPGEGGEIKLTLDLQGKTGTLYKTATIDTLAGFKDFAIKVTLPGASGSSVDEQMRLQNQKLAATNRQVVFRADCAGCHANPLLRQTGAALYAAACGICHEATHRASMVPDLHQLMPPASKSAWRKIIAEGKPNSLMPGFASEVGGPLTSAQIDSLADYLSAAFPPLTLPRPADSARGGTR